ncbi:hypothetical protein Tsubulata_040920 [Turnera subulata]|uniref:F-box domain-containing protein n=1 Tax=Turnera subulata TaxID=218843 RepID=A0A9Q0GBC7_9ROSI|nr:hypothetical protein Tsubulata_040920 [Turnera subulata]
MDQRTMDTILYQKRQKKRHKKEKKKSCSFSSLDDLLCDELLEQILCRVELKTIYRCKSVCKRWLSTISSPEFINRYVGFHQSVTPISSMFYLALDLRPQDSRHSSYRLDIRMEAKASSWSSSFISFHLYPKHPTHRPSHYYYFNLVGSWNGLVLCREETPQPRYHVCNPITGDWLVLPPPPLRWYSLGCALIDDDGSITTTGGGPSGFKVVLIDQESRGYFNVSFFSTSTGKWHGRRVRCAIKFSHIEKGGLVCCNRMLYWVGKGDGNRFIIIGYDTYKPSDQCSYIQLPVALSKTRNIQFPVAISKTRNTSQLYLGVNQGRIMVCRKSFNQKEYLRIWELQDCTTGSWCLKHELALNSRRLDLPVSDYRILAIHPIDGDIVYLEQREDNSILSLNMKDKSKQVVAPSSLLRLSRDHAFLFFLDLNNLKQTWW